MHDYEGSCGVRLVYSQEAGSDALFRDEFQSQPRFGNEVGLSRFAYYYIQNLCWQTTPESRLLLYSSHH